jgi:RNA polymerase sigma-70 factor, ECF subfamily
MARLQGPLDDETFPHVLDGVRVGEQWAAEALFLDLQPRLLRFLRGTEPRAGDDLAGEVWLAVAQGIRQFEGDLAGFRAWVFTIARRRLVDHRRTAVRRATDPVDDAMFQRRPYETSAADTATSVLDQLSAQEAVDLINANLPEEHAQVLLLRVLGELDVAHVAEVMGRTSNWVRVTQHRALRRLADRLAEGSGGKTSLTVMHATPETI